MPRSSGTTSDSSTVTTPASTVVPTAKNAIRRVPQLCSSAPPSCQRMSAPKMTPIGLLSTKP